MCLTCLAATAPATAEPYTPASRATVLLKLAAPSQSAFAQLRSRVNEPATDEAAARALAQKYLIRARQQADPRYLGYAEAVLDPWLALDSPPVDLLVLQASILQSRHDFPQAVSVLKNVLARDPDHNQALLTLATLYQVQGRLDAATQTCRQLLAVRTDLVGITCLANAQSLRGELKSSYTTLAATADNRPGLEPGVLSWVQASLAEMAVRLGQPDTARVHFQRALGLTPENAYLLAAYSDLLLAADQPKAVLELLAGREAQDGLLLRMILAGMATQHPDTGHWTQMLSARFEAAQQRGDDTGHLRERARFALDILNQPAQAARLAAQNWQSQREPADLLLLLRAAHMANATELKQAGLQWIKKMRYEDARIAADGANP